ncbi:uncharacterized protein UDID_17621 [Ustilago sp. UG-2017a]|nr:uncharacterized protein UDID_17621 [Ustilago sp. UG-2017a]
MSHLGVTDSPAGTNTHELDTSAEDAMFGHAVMDRSSSPSLVPPQVSSRKGSASSTHSTSSITPKLPPRPPAGGGAGGSLAPSPTISEFGQFPSTTPAKTKGGVEVRYATYTPGVKKPKAEESAAAMKGPQSHLALAELEWLLLALTQLLPPRLKDDACKGCFRSLTRLLCPLPAVVTLIEAPLLQ